MLFANREDAERVYAVLGKRLAKFGLELHPDKTQLIDCRSAVAHVDVEKMLPRSFTFLGFIHTWGKSRKGNPTMWQRTAKDRLARTLKAINRQCRFMRPWPLAEQHRRLCRMLQGHNAYFGISGNYECLSTVLYQSRRLWHKWLSRRSWKSHLTWERYERLLQNYPLPAPRIIHRYC